ncbi:hypothetical protein ACFO5R_18525 [Halosolutus amylolyticus]|uniref:DUF2795 domain-containing protein n=1 Tax=Halosolutus amylolyticus TaxID=2932267 RepID=A0ABD5PTT7_9EURY|nr:hypothetical protein [Halosolutus amylolyticus]
MTDNHPERTRELGVEFGDLYSKLREHGYPITTEELVDVYGEDAIQLPWGSTLIKEVLDPIATETYESPAEAREAIFNMVDSRAIGRKYYSDRTPPALGERRQDEQLSF